MKAIITSLFFCLIIASFSMAGSTVHMDKYDKKIDNVSFKVSKNEIYIGNDSSILGDPAICSVLGCEGGLLYCCHITIEFPGEDEAQTFWCFEYDPFYAKLV